MPSWGSGWPATPYASIGASRAAAFHERYHETVLAEFGVDDRPTAPEADDD